MFFILLRDCYCSLLKKLKHIFFFSVGPAYFYAYAWYVIFDPETPFHALYWFYNTLYQSTFCMHDQWFNYTGFILTPAQKLQISILPPGQRCKEAARKSGVAGGISKGWSLSTTQNFSYPSSNTKDISISSFMHRE